MPCWRECSVRLQRRLLVERGGEIAGAGDILLDNVVVGFESIWHTLTADPPLNVVFVEWNKSGQCCTKLGIFTRTLYVNVNAVDMLYG